MDNIHIMLTYYFWNAIVGIEHSNDCIVSGNISVLWVECDQLHSQRLVCRTVGRHHSQEPGQRKTVMLHEYVIAHLITCTCDQTVIGEDH